ncbi:MAG: MlaD family protein [Myxococcota bacterium]
MSRRANPAFIGGFVVGAVVLLVVGIMAFGSGALFRNTTTYVMFFGGDLSGLRVGAPVTFRGVPLGTVTDIRASLQRRFDRVETRIAVYAELQEGAIDIGDDMPRPGAEAEGYRLLIENGLRAQLQWQSLVTGQLFVQLDFHPDEPPIFVGGDPSVLEIPTIPTPFEMVTRSARRVLERLGELPLEEIVENLNETLEGAGKLLNADDTHQALAGLNAAVADLRGAIRRTDRRVGHVVERLDETLDNTNLALQEARGSLGALSEESELRYELNELLREATDAMRAMRVLAETLERNPESLLSGKGGGR